MTDCKKISGKLSNKQIMLLRTIAEQLRNYVDEGLITKNQAHTRLKKLIIEESRKHRIQTQSASLMSDIFKAAKGE